MFSAPRSLELYFPPRHTPISIVYLFTPLILPWIMDWSLQGFCYSDVISECISNNEEWEICYTWMKQKLFNARLSFPRLHGERRHNAPRGGGEGTNCV